jgi:predicted DNA-binding transcriptional regulator AlpA
VAFLTLQRVADEEQRSLRTLQRQIRKGVGPRLVQLSERRVGVHEDDYREWVEARRRPPVAPATP